MNKSLWRRPFRTVWVCLLAMGLGGCRHGRHPSESAIHSITDQLAAASEAAAPGSVVKFKKSATGDPDPSDRVLVQVRTADASAWSGTKRRLLEAWSAVARRHRLTADAPERSPGSLRMRLRSGATVTHEIVLEREQPDATAGGPRLAVILDDLGSDAAAAEAVFALHVPLTVSVLPGHPHSAEIASEARSKGLEVMLHLPMQAAGNQPSEAAELRPGMSSRAVADLLEQLLERVPGAVGVNNHQGSEATADGQLMAELMPVLGSHGLFYIDSRTTAATVAFRAAQSAGIPSAFRNVPFLDDVPEVTAVKKQLALAFRGARDKREAIAIGHPHPQTIRALAEVLPQAESLGVRLVFASELVH